MAQQPDIECVLSAQAINGESPAWSASEKRLYWIDVKKPAMHRFDPATKQDEWWELPSWIGCAVPDGTGRVLMALRDGIGWLDCPTGELHMLAPAPFDARQNSANDGKCDPHGRFLFGTMSHPLHPIPTRAPKAYPVFRFDAATMRCVPLTRDITESNGMAWSPDGRTMYHSATKQKTIHAFDFDARDGLLTNRRLFARVEAPGGAVDSEGFYWSCVFGTGKLLRFDPEGQIEREIVMPVLNPTMPAFGGEDLRTLYVTTARRNESALNELLHAEDGNLFAFEAPAPGAPCALADNAYFV
jgi:sugar lactone lactonase YvrE